jgi:hypothetical protein
MTTREVNSPCHDQSQQSIKKWLRANVKVGTLVVIRRIQNGKLQYERAAVLSVRPKNFNVGVQQRDGTIAASGETYDWSGSNWRDPKGPARLVLPTATVLKACDVCEFGAAFMPGNARDYVFSVHFR